MACSTIASVTTLTTNSPVTRMFCNVSFSCPSLKRRSGAKHTVGGSAATPVKNENGARFGTSCALQVETNAIGRGNIEPMISL